MTFPHVEEVDIVKKSSFTLFVACFKTKKTNRYEIIFAKLRQFPSTQVIYSFVYAINILTHIFLPISQSFYLFITLASFFPLCN